MRLKEDFYTLPATELAPQLLGNYLCRNINGEILRCKILETEAYYGEEDTACHAHKGKTERTKVMYEKGGIAYIYLCYGIHFLLNIVSGEEGFPEAVLIRGIEGFNGPGKLTKALKIDKSLSKECFITSENMWIEKGEAPLAYITTPRIGIDYACDIYRPILWRFLAGGEAGKE